MAHMMEKSEVRNLEKQFEEQLEDQKPTGTEDYSGAVAKTDPAEITLVRKLDWFILPTLWIMVNTFPSSVIMPFG